MPLLCVQLKTPDEGQKCPKHVEFYSKYKFEILVHLVGFIVRMSINCAFVGSLYKIKNMHGTSVKISR